MIGTKLAHFEITSHLGSGGMGDVYQATDTKLGRSVAIKFLPEAFNHDSERVMRFQREARVLASLSHPNIAGIHGLEEIQGRHFLIMELVPGETLAERIQRGPIPLAEVLDIAKQIAEALEDAHEKGIIHRDLKPANVKVGVGKVKVLDFGLAKALENSPAASSASAISNSPTLTLGHTMAGQILGTAAYMAPEQIEGREADRRADIWSFGVVLFEMLGGKRAFDGSTSVETLASVVKLDPDWSALPKNTPSYLVSLIRRCLTKDWRRRLQAIGEARILLENPPAAVEPATAKEAQAPRPPRIAWVVAGLLALVAGALGLVVYRHAREPLPRLSKLSILPPDKGEIGVGVHPFALSPDGKHLAFVASVEGKRELWLRDLNSPTPRVIPGSEGASGQFWSPDSRFLAFAAQGKVKKIDISGGPPLTICDTPAFRGGTWNSDDVILLASNQGGILRVAAAGGSPTPVTELDATRKEDRHVAPWFLPDGRHFLFLARSTDPEKTAISVGDLQSKERKQILVNNYLAIYAEYAGLGYLLYAREQTVLAQRFDPGKLVTAGDPVPIAEQVDVNASQNYAMFTASSSGDLAYSNGSAAGTVQIRWFDRTGKVLADVGKPQDIEWASLSPDGKTIASDVRDSQTSKRDVWLYDLDRGTSSRLTFSGDNQFPVWSPDGSRVAYLVVGDKIHIKAANGTGQEEIRETMPNVRPTDWSRDGKYLFLEPPGGWGKTRNDIWVSPDSGDKKMYAYLQTDFSEGFARLSPDGKWLAYRSDESKRFEIYVVTFPQLGGKWQISTNGGSIPVWSRDGRELFFIGSDNKLMAVEIKSTGGKFEAGIPKPLFDVRLGTNNPSFDVSKDGRVLIPTALDQGSKVPITLVLNWGEMLPKK